MKLTDLSLVALSSFSSLIRIPFPVSPTLVPSLCSAVSDSSETLYPWDFPDENTGVGYHFLLQGIFPTQGSNLNLLSLTLRDRLFTTAPPGKPLIYTACCAVLSHVRLFAPPWTVAHQALLSMGILQARVANLRGPTI